MIFNKEFTLEAYNNHAKWMNDRTEGERLNLSFVDLTGSDLSYANLKGATLWGANLTNVDLTKASLVDANLTRADLTNANLKWVDLRRATLKGVNFTNANLTWVDLDNKSRVKLIDDNLRGATGLPSNTLSYLSSGVSVMIAYLVGAYTAAGLLANLIGGHWILTVILTGVFFAVWVVTAIYWLTQFSDNHQIKKDGIYI